jgi:hypothetical protein
MMTEPVDRFKSCLLKAVSDANFNVTVTITHDDTGVTVFIKHSTVDFKYRQYISYDELDENAADMELICLKLVEQIEYHWKKLLFKEIR